MHGLGVAKTTEDTMKALITETEARQLIKEYPCTDGNLLSAMDYIREVVMERELDPKLLLQSKEVLAFERKSQKPAIPGLVSSIIKHINEHLKGYKGKVNIYDIGCGNGEIAIELADQMKDAKIYAYDPDKEAIKDAKKNNTKGLKNVTFSSEPWANDGDIHVVVCINVLHDVDKPNEFIQMIDHKLHKDGIAFIVDPKVSVNRDLNLNIPVTVSALAIGTYSCVHFNPCDCAEGPGIGKEVLLQYIENNGLQVIGDFLLIKSLYYHCFLAKKPMGNKIEKYAYNFLDLAEMHRLSMK